MFSWFRKSQPPVDLSSANGDQAEWILGRAKNDTGLMLIRRNRSAETFVGHPQLGIKLGFAIPFGVETEGDLPDPEENSQVSEIEDQIVAEVAKATTGVHVLTLTDKTCKELIFYIKPGADIGAIHERLLADITTHEVQCIAEHDAEWELYRHFTPNIK